MSKMELLKKMTQIQKKVAYDEQERSINAK